MHILDKSLVQLYISKNLGSDWEKVSSYVNPRFFWADGNYDKNDTVIHLEAQDPQTGTIVISIVR